MEDLSQRSETTQVFANPDGSWTSESALSPVRARDENGNWVDIDLTLEKVDGGYAPANALGDLVIPDGGDQTFAEMTVEGRDLAWKWPTALPTPTVEGETATYANVVDGGDLVVTATPDGFRHDIVLHRAPASPVAFDIPVVTTGPKITEDHNGDLSVKTKSGEELVSAAPPVMYDAPDPATGEPEHQAPVDTTVTATATGGVVTLDPDEAFLNDPSTTYPVTIDPTYNSNASQPDDTWVYNTSPTATHPNDATLYVGTPNAGTTKYRSYIRFNGLGSLPGATVSSATLTLRNFYTSACSGAAAGVEVRRVIGDWTPGGLNWNNQPVTATSDAVRHGTAYGATGCPANDVSWPVTTMVQAWANGQPNNGFRVAGYDETKTGTSRQYRAAGTYNPPFLTVTYNHAPNTPSYADVSPYQNGFSNTTTPTLSADVSDPDPSDTVRARFNFYSGSNLIWYADGSPVTGSGTSTLQVPAGVLTNGGSYTVQAWGNDGISPWSAGHFDVPITVDTTNPTVNVTSSAYGNGQWLETPPTSNTFTLTGSADTATFQVEEDGDPSEVDANASGSATVDWNPDSGAHVLKVTPVDKAGNSPSTPFSFSFGTNKPDFTAPDDAQTSAGSFPVTASGPPVATAATVTWRLAGTTAWNPVTGLTDASGSAWSGSVTTSSGGAGTTTGSLKWKATDETDPATGTKISSPSLLELRTCFTVPVGGPLCSDARKIQLTSAFGGNFPVATLGPAQVALYTGEATIDGFDAADSKAGVARSFSSFNPATQTAGVFGPGWSDPSLLTAPSADAKAEVVDNRTKDGSFVIVDTDSGSQTFVAKPNSATEYVPLRPTGDATALTFTAGSGGSLDKLQLSRPVGAGSVTTTWTLKTSDSGAAPAWTVDTVNAPGSGSDVTVTSATGSQRPIWIRESDPSIAATCTATTQTAGCRGLAIIYTGTGAATRVSSVSRVIGADDQGAVVTKILATYAYDDASRLATACSAVPAEGKPALCTGYSYTTVNGRTLLSQVVPAGLKPWRFDYDAKGRLTTVTREKPTGGDATWNVDYSLHPGATGLPDTSASKAAEWGQQTIPTRVFAVYEPYTGTADVTKAQLYYTTDDGTRTNTATYGPSGWLLDTSWYDAKGNEVRHLDPTGWARVQAATAANRPQTAADASSYTVYNTWGDANTVGTRVVDEYGPAHSAVLEDGTSGFYRTHTHTMFDDDPNVDTALITATHGSAGLGLAVKQVRSTSDAARTTDYDKVVTKYGYEPIVAGDGNGWTLGSPTSVSIQVDSNMWSTQTSRFDTSGRQVESRQPGGSVSSSGAGNDAHSTVTSYYKAAPGSGDCDGKPAWDGLVCKVGPPSGGQPSGPTVPTTFTADYNDDLAPTVVRETSGDTARTTTTTYDALGRVSGVTKATTGQGVTNETITTAYGYDDTTGLATTTSSGGETVTTGYDTWGRQSSYTDALGTSSQTTYDAAGHEATFDDGVGTYSYNYDSHGILTGVDTGAAGMFTYAYTSAGDVESVTYPNGMVARRSYDEIGQQTGLTYKQGTTTLLAFSASQTAEGRTTATSSPASTRNYTYDGIGRLTKVQDSRASGCTTRTYGFDASSNRATFARYAPNPSGGCQTTTAATSTSNTYDSAGRIRNPGYTYDSLGRTLTTPQSDAGANSSGDLVATYHADDKVASLSQNVLNGSGGNDALATSYGLDPVERVSTLNMTTNGVETKRLRYRFAADGDSPASIDTSTDGGNTWSSVRYVNVPELGMAASTNSGATTLQLANLHGDIVATMDATLGSPAIASYAETDEYGNADGGAATPRYGWLGSNQRATDTPGGMTLMGARVYNPATGLFLQSDPIRGGGATNYSYPTDPVNMTDLTGELWGSLFNWGMKALKFGMGSICGATVTFFVACRAVVSGSFAMLTYIGWHLLVKHDSWHWENAVAYFIYGALASLPGSGLVAQTTIGAMKYWVGRLLAFAGSKFSYWGWGSIASMMYLLRDKVNRMLTATNWYT